MSKKSSLTDTAIRGAKPNDKPLKLFDSNGLFLFVAPNGTKSWRVKYRIQGREKLLTLGTYPTLSLKEAREACMEAKKQISGGVDPSLEKKVRARSVHTTFEAVAREWHENQKPTWTPGYTKDVMERIEKNVFPLLGSRPIGEISPPELLAVLRKIELRGAVDQAHRVRSICSLVFRYAIATGRAERDTAADLRGALKTRSRTPRAAITEPQAIGGLLRAIDDFPGTFIVKAGLQLLALTFLRPSEVRLGEWAEIDFTEKVWRIPSKRMKMRLDHMVPLSAQALEVLQTLQEVTGHEKLMFPGLRSPQVPISDATFIAALRRMGFAKEEMTAHGFRAMASTLLNEQGYSADVIEKQLAHNPKDKIRGVYNRAEYLPERRKMMQEWADYLSKLKG
ncbi:tyrosine-type recombinase/integrase [Desulfovibrio cuneatus]|uniref:tyrosine-type recombinase/integrase n=1 Tax=Desulfovibrio cuneatus TaxID=159728 RepID=UPI000426C1FF|nr:integrase arm-type DNA-binding domain-containing protein [Desulfovibrio cuneatus]